MERCQTGFGMVGFERNVAKQTSAEYKIQLKCDNP